MLSYRHSFHAGNHGDVLKHWLLVSMLEYLNQKDKPYWYVDTHSGSGKYNLKSVYSKKIEEHEGGISKLKQADGLNESLNAYLERVNSMGGHQGKLYPGSPLIAQSLTRDIDKLRLFELHPTDSKKLVDAIGRDRRVRIEEADGLKGLKSLVPPPTKRALVLIDPSYEVKKEYSAVIKAVQDSLTRFSIGVYAVWYPLLKQVDNINFQQRLEKAIDAKWINIQLIVDEHPNAPGMYGSGMFIVNPPWVLKQLCEECLPLLADALGVEGRGTFRITDSGNL